MQHGLLMLMLQLGCNVRRQVFHINVIEIVVSIILTTAFIIVVVHILTYLIVLVRHILVMSMHVFLIVRSSSDIVLLMMSKFSLMLLNLGVSTVLSNLSLLYIFHKESFIRCDNKLLVLAHIETGLIKVIGNKVLEILPILNLIVRFEFGPLEDF